MLRFVSFFHANREDHPPNHPIKYWDVKLLARQFVRVDCNFCNGIGLIRFFPTYFVCNEAVEKI